MARYPGTRGAEGKLRLRATRRPVGGPGRGRQIAWSQVSESVYPSGKGSSGSLPYSPMLVIHARPVTVVTTAGFPPIRAVATTSLRKRVPMMDLWSKPLASPDLPEGVHHRQARRRCRCRTATGRGGLARRRRCSRRSGRKPGAQAARSAWLLNRRRSGCLHGLTAAPSPPPGGAQSMPRSLMSCKR
jgi:hypothetical protein